MKAVVLSAVLFLAAAIGGVESVGWRTSLAVKLSIPRAFIGQGVLGNKAYFAGGEINNGNDVTKRIDVYDSTTDVWSTAELSVKRSSIGVASIGTTHIVFAGGQDTNIAGASSRIDIYTASTGVWSTAELSMGLSRLSGVAHGSKAYFVGGSCNCASPAGSYSYTDLIEVYDSVTGAVTQFNMPVGRSDIAATVVGNNLYFAGGYNPLTSALVWWVHIYDTVSGTFTNITLPQPRNDMTATSIGTKAIFAGGDNSATAQSSVFILQTTDNTWTTGTLALAMVEWQRPAMTITDAAGVQYAVFGGGFNHEAGGVQDTVSFCTVDGTCTTKGGQNGLSYPKRGAVSGLAVGSKIIFAGGFDANNTERANLDIYETSYCWDAAGVAECKNGGVCTGGATSFTCACASGWTGATCTTPGGTAGTGGAAGNSTGTASAAVGSYGASSIVTVATAATAIFLAIAGFAAAN